MRNDRRDPARGKLLPVALIGSLILVSLGPATLAQEGTAVLKGTILEEGTQAPLEGVQIVIKDLTTGSTLESLPSTAAGEWSIEVAAPARYQIIGMRKDGGPIQEITGTTPRPIRLPGVYEFPPIVAVEAAPPAAAAAAEPGAPEPAAPAEKKKKDKAGKKNPWTSPGAIVGYIAGAVLIYLALEDDDDEQPPSPSQ